MLLWQSMCLVSVFSIGRLTCKTYADSHRFRIVRFVYAYDGSAPTCIAWETAGQRLNRLLMNTMLLVEDMYE